MSRLGSSSSRLRVLLRLPALLSSTLLIPRLLRRGTGSAISRAISLEKLIHDVRDAGELEGVIVDLGELLGGGLGLGTVDVGLAGLHADGGEAAHLRVFGLLVELDLVLGVVVELGDAVLEDGREGGKVGVVETSRSWGVATLLRTGTAENTTDKLGADFKGGGESEGLLGHGEDGDSDDGGVLEGDHICGCWFCWELLIGKSEEDWKWLKVLERLLDCCEDGRC